MGTKAVLHTSTVIPEYSTIPVLFAIEGLVALQTARQIFGWGKI
jgi:hypothetical protein